MSHKIKFNLNKQQNKKPLEELPNEKISISIGGPIEKKKKSDNLDKKSTKIKEFSGITPVIRGWARIHGYNKIIVDDDDPFCNGFQVI